MTDLNGAVRNYAVATSSFSLCFKHGQCCCAESRMFMKENMNDDLMAKRVETAKKTKMVDPFYTKTE
jgi:acyl-CoA reductase-like NAD-dependent aldehyde dehydrogenase